MSVSIDTVTIGSVEDRRMVLSNAQAARVIDIGSNWTRLRVGLRMAIDKVGNVISTPRFYIGMMASPSAGMANGPLGNSTSHFIGYRSGTATWSDLGGDYLIDNSATNPETGKKIGATFTGANIAPTFRASNLPATVRNAAIVEITKGTPNFNVAVCFPTGSAPNDCSLGHLKNAMNIDLLTGAATYLQTAVGTSYSRYLGADFAVDEATDGYLNAVCVAWDRSSPTIHISDILWAKMA